MSCLGGRGASSTGGGPDALSSTHGHVVVQNDIQPEHFLLFDRATRALERGKGLVVSPGWTEGHLGRGRLKQGDAEGAFRILQEMIGARRTASVSATSIACLAAGLGRYGETFAWFDEAY